MTTLTQTVQSATGSMDACTIPALEPHCGSWIVVNRDSEKTVCETYSRMVAEAFSRQEKYEVLTAAQWLARFNSAALKAGGAK